MSADDVMRISCVSESGQWMRLGTLRREYHLGLFAILESPLSGVAEKVEALMDAFPYAPGDSVFIGDKRAL